MNKTSLVSAVSALLNLVTTGALAQDWQPQLLPPERAVRGPADSIQIELPPLAPTVVSNLALELDEVDVTALMSTEDGRLVVFVPPQPLSYGSHQLRLIEYASDGSIIERGLWTLDIRRTRAFREATLHSAVTVNAVRRIADDNLVDPEPPRDNLNGAAQFEGALSDEQWRATASLDLIGNSEESQMPRQQGELDLGRFLLTGEAGVVSVAAGHHAVPTESLVMQGFDRRGVSVNLRSSQGRAMLTAFSMRTEEVIGFEEGLGVGDEDNRTDGVVLVAIRSPGGPRIWPFG